LKSIESTTPQKGQIIVKSQEESQQKDTPNPERPEASHYKGIKQPTDTNKPPDRGSIAACRLA
jgi:hypothetical protein